MSDETLGVLDRLALSNPLRRLSNFTALHKDHEQQHGTDN